MIVIVGIGADGWAGLGEPARDALQAAPTVIGSERQLALLPADVPGERRPWPSPIDPLVDELAAGRHDGAAVLASGDPMLHGIGSSLARRGVALAVQPHPSAVAYACARLGWAEAEVDLVNIVGRSPDALARVLQPRRRVVVFGTAASAAAVVVDRGYGPSRFVVLEQLGGPRRARHREHRRLVGRPRRRPAARGRDRVRRRRGHAAPPPRPRPARRGLRQRRRPDQAVPARGDAGGAGPAPARAAVGRRRRQRLDRHRVAAGRADRPRRRDRGARRPGRAHRAQRPAARRAAPRASYAAQRPTRSRPSTRPTPCSSAAA